MAKTVSVTASKNNAATLRAMLAPAATATKIFESTAPQTVKATAPQTVKTVAPVAPQTVKTGMPTTLKIDGFSMAYDPTTADGAKLRESVMRETQNPWYPVMVWLAAQKPGHITISRDGSAKSPMSRIDSAIARARKAGVKGWRNLDAKSGNEKGVWFLIHRA